MRYLWAVSWMVAGVLLAGCDSSISATPVPTPNQTERQERQSARVQDADAPLNRFGVVEGFWFPELTCELGAGWERIIFNWEQHQPTNPDDWHTLNVDDRWLSVANDCQREVVALLKHTPAWATDGLAGAGVPRGLYLPVDDPENLWANFVRKTVSYYQGRMGRGVNHFIIWNEPDIESGTYGYEFEGLMEDYLQLLKVAYVVAKEANPDAVIHLAGTTYWHDVNAGRTPYMERLIERILQDEDAAAHGYYFDVLSLHIYFRTDSIYDISLKMREMLDAHGLTDKKIWINETNAAPTDDPLWKVERPQFQVDLQQQAAFLVQVAAGGLAAGVERMAVYKFYDQALAPGDESFGILNPVDASPRPAFFAWEMVADWFNETQQAHLARSKTAEVVRLSLKDGRHLMVAWSRTESATKLHIESSGQVQSLDLYGRVTPLESDSGAYEIHLPGTRCDAKEGCYIGGLPAIVILPDANFSVQEITSSGAIALKFQ